MVCAGAMPSARALALCLALLAACAHSPPQPTRLLEDAAAQAKAPGASAHTEALAGFHALLVEGNADEAGRLFQSALAKDAGEPFALSGTGVLAERVAHPEAALAAALELCIQRPSHPLAPLAAHTVASLAGRALGMDATILLRAPVALAHGAKGDTAFQLRLALASLEARRDVAAEAALRADMGLVSTLALVGPLAALRALAFDAATPPERDGALPPTLPGPFGAMPLRVVPVPDGELSLASEGPSGDVYVAGVDFVVPAEASYVVRTAGNGAYRTVLDGTVLYSRRPFAAPTSLVSGQGVVLPAGPHRLLVTLLRGERPASVSLAVFRADGQPAALHFKPAEGPAPRWASVRLVAVEGIVPTAESIYKSLLPEAGEALATYLAVRDAEGRDRDGSKRLLAAAGLPTAPAWAVLRARVAVGDSTVPSKLARGRAAQYLEAALEKDARDVESQLDKAALALEEQRNAQAGEAARAARAAHTPVGYPVDLLQARLSLALGLDAQGDVLAQEALRAVDGVCAALSLRYDLAMRRDGVADADRLLTSLRSCPGEEGRAVEHAKARGRLAEATSLARRRLAEEPSSVALGQGLAALLLAEKKPAEGVAVLTALQALWPRDAGLRKRTAELQALAGDTKGALASRRASLLLDGSDLSLRRLVERESTGKELLAAQAVDGRAALKAYEAGSRDEDAPSVLVLDAAATRAYPDGSTVDRIHTIQKVLDQSGIQEVAEVTLPPGAQLLALRTLKADGKVLEPESIEGKETISMPGVAVGDSVEQEFLLARGARGPAIPGWTAAGFYFQVAQVPDYWATYTVLAPAGSGMAVDAHNMTAPAVQVKGGDEVYHQEVRRSPPFLPEPESPPAANELLPLVLVGAGARGQEALLTAVTDAALERLRPTAEVEAFARAAAGTRTGLEAVRALYTAVHGRLAGHDGGLGQSAAASLAAERGSRLTLLRASLEVLGIASRVVAVRTFAVDPGPYLYPSEGLFPYLCLRVEVPGAAPVWLDTLVRFAPFAELPEQAAGGREAYLLPEPGRPLERTETPPGQKPPGKEVTLALALAEDGTLAGRATDVYRGFEAAQLAEALDALSTEEKKQALQNALGGGFGGAELADIQLDAPRAVGAQVTVRYAFRASHFARVEQQRMVLGPLTYATFLGRRYVQVAQRRMPLFIESTEGTTSHVTLALPPGWVLDQPLPEAKVAGPFGAFFRTESQGSATLKVEERYRLDMARIPVDKYEAFASFAGEVDLLQSRDVVLRRPGAQPPNTASAAGARGMAR
jgi:cellulose synthase operon protein C